MWSPDPGYPKKLAPVLVPIEQYEVEPITKYNQRVYRWRCWVDTEIEGIRPPMTWYSLTVECQNYEAWAELEKAARSK